VSPAEQRQRVRDAAIEIGAIFLAAALFALAVWVWIAQGGLE
jgi:predicted nucleic acid-binding Zn ribbon protein